jgi:hypothetical protein
MGRKFAGLLATLTLISWSVTAHAAVVPYTVEKDYTDALEAGGYSSFQEGFENNGAWGAVRSTSFIFNTAPSVTSQGIEWTTNHPAMNEITTVDSAPVTGEDWLIWDLAGGFAAPPRH